QQEGCPGNAETPRLTPDCCGSISAQPASASTPWSFRIAVEGSFFRGVKRIEVTRSASEGGDEVEGVGGIGTEEEVVVVVDVGMEVDEDMVVDGGVEVLEDEVDVDVAMVTVVDEVEVEVGGVELVELDVVDVTVEEVDEVEVVDDVAVEELDVEVGVVDADVDEVVEVVDVELDVVDEVVVEVEVVELDVVDVEVVGAAVEEVVEVDVADVEVEEVVEVDVVVVGTALPPAMSPMLISSATKVPKITAWKRFNVAGFPRAQSWATTVVVVSPVGEIGARNRNRQVLVASGIAWAALRWSVKSIDSWEPPEMLMASCLPLTSTRRSCGHYHPWRSELR